MKEPSKKIRKGHGVFTFLELLTVIAILGVLATVATLAVTQFVGSGTLESAKAEFNQAQTAVAACMADAGANQLDNTTARRIVGWNGGPNVVTVDVDHDGNANYDAADYVHGLFKASYLVDDDGEVWGIGAGGHPWTNLRWGENGWEWADQTLNHEQPTEASKLSREALARNCLSDNTSYYYPANPKVILKLQSLALESASKWAWYNVVKESPAAAQLGGLGKNFSAGRTAKETKKVTGHSTTQIEEGVK